MFSTDFLYLLYLSTGFTVGFGHCIGMCGPLVVSLSLNLKDKGVTIPHLLYNSGRIITYALMGGVMGATGSFTAVAAHLATIQKGVMIFAGILIIVMGLAMTGWIPFGKIFGDYYNPTGLISKGFRKLSAAHSTWNYLPIGLLLGLLPCGPVYTALLGTARAGMDASSMIQGILKGAGLMLAFGAGTAPALFLVAKLSNLGWLKSREIIYKIGSLMMITVGVYFVVKAIKY